MNIDLPEVMVGNAGISKEQGAVRTSEQLIELLQVHGIVKVKLRPHREAGYEVIGQLIYGLTRAGIAIELVESPIAC